MVLNFLGNGSGFADEHTSAYFFTEKNEMVIIDCSMLNVQKLKKMDLSCYDRFFILITHTHGDHVSGLGLWVQYVYFTLKKEVTIISPSEIVLENLLYLLQEIEGCDASWYNIFCANEIHLPWFVQAIPTTHSPQLEGKCFGYRLNINGKNVIYTGDTSTLKPFTPFLNEENSELYVDVSIHYGMIHLKLDDVICDLVNYAHNNIKVYLMHLDDKNAAAEIIEKIPDMYLA